MMLRRAFQHIAAATLCLLCTVTAPAAAQDEPDARSITWLNGVSVGVPGYGEETAPSLFTIAFHGTRIEHGRPGFDYSVATIPRALSEGFLVIGGRGGLAWPLAPSPDLILLPSVGVAFLAGLTRGGGGELMGGNAGIAAFILNERASGLRVGASWHRFGNVSGAVWLLELGFVRGW